MKMVSNTLMRFVAAASLWAAVLPTVVLAENDGPTARKAREATAMGGAVTTRQRAAAAWAGPAATDQELEEVTDFMRKFAPARWAALDALPEGGAGHRGVMVYVVARWRHLQILREEDLELYEIKVSQMAVEDAIYGLLARTRTPAEREPLRKHLREKVGELVKLGLTERAHRIERLRQALKAEEDRLARDQGGTKSVVERRVDAFITDGPVTLHAEMPRRPRHTPGASTSGAEETPDRPAGK